MQKASIKMTGKKFYWLKLKEDFFDEDTIEWLEEQENGKEYCLFYLKLCLKSLKTDGVLVRNVGQMLIPYDVKKIAEMTKTKLDTAMIAMDLLKNIGLIQILDNGEIYMTQLKKMVGSESKWAEKKRLQREKQESGDNVPTLSQKCPREIRDKSIEIEKEIEIEKDIKPVRHKYGEYKNVLLSDEDMEKMRNEFPNDYEKRIESLSSYMASTGKSYKNHLATIRNWSRKEKKEVKTHEEIIRDAQGEYGHIGDWL
mgnify:FL=1